MGIKYVRVNNERRVSSKKILSLTLKIILNNPFKIPLSIILLCVYRYPFKVPSLHVNGNVFLHTHYSLILEPQIDCNTYFKFSSFFFLVNILMFYRNESNPEAMI